MNMAHGFSERGGFTEQGLVELDAALVRNVSPGEVPGLVALVARADGPRNGQVHVTVAGSATLGDPGTAGDLGSPLRRDSIFRIASMSKPVTGVAAMLLIEDGAMALDDPVERWLPELGARRVLRALDSPLDDTVPAARPVTVEDVLSFRLGFGCIMTPGSYPIADAEASLGLKTLGPPWPPGRHTSDEWIAALSGLPLMDQPGQRWRYNTGATVAGILIERVTSWAVSPACTPRPGTWAAPGRTWSCSTRQKAGTPRHPCFLTERPGSCPRSMTSGRSPRCSPGACLASRRVRAKAPGCCYRSRAG
jgi:hypothetical protein